MGNVDVVRLEGEPIVVGEHCFACTAGCGSPIPPALEGCTVLDLGCGNVGMRYAYALAIKRVVRKIVIVDIDDRPRSE